MKNEYIDKMLKNLNHTYYAHTKASGSKELLASHLELTYKYYKEMEKQKSLDIIIKNIIKRTFKMNASITEEVYALFEQAIYYHDIGKINPLFQKNKMDNDLNIEVNNTDDSHAALSARIYIDSVIEKFKTENCKDSRERIIILYMGYFFGYIISRHHTKLEDFYELLDSIKNKNIPEIPEIQKDTYESHLDAERLEKIYITVQPEPIELYVLCKLLYTCIIISDFYATYDYMSGHKVEFEIKRNNYLFNKYENSELMNTIRQYENKEIEIQGINKLRSDIFLETEKNLYKNLDKNIFYLEAPTGAGKTNMAINLARILYKSDEKIDSIHYIFPFNNIIEQTDSTFQNYFEKYNDYVVVNSISAMADEKNEKLDYDEIYVRNVFNQYPIVITSHINLFNTLFGISKEKNYGLYNYINSVVILDEIQAYSNNIWREMIEMLDKYANLLNIKFIIMSATLPRLDNMLNEKMSSFVSVVEDAEKYYSNNLFKERVILNYDLLKEKIDIDRLIEEIMKHQDRKVLVECIRKKTAEDLYEKLKEINDNVYIMTGDDNKIYRKKIIEKTKNDKEIILIATQTIEAGVDIDMDIGFKDVSFIDSEEQFLGRINRSSKKKNCIVYFFNLDESRVIYRKDKRVGYSLEKKENQAILENKDFKTFYGKIMKRIEEEANSYTKSNIENFKNECMKLNYRYVAESLKLIDDKQDKIDLFINYTINVEGKEIKGKDVFDEYTKIYTNKEMSYSEKKVKLSQISEKMNLFIYSIYANQIQQIQGEKICGIYYVEDGEKYIENGRFNKAKYLENGEELFL